MPQSKQKGLQTYPGNTFLSPEPACTIHNNVYLSTQSKQKGLQNYSGNTFLSLELAGGGQIWKLIKGKWLSLAIPNNMHLAKNAVK